MTAFWVQRYYWKGKEVRESSSVSRKNIVYDYWIASNNNLKPRFYWIRSLDSALLSISVALPVIFGDTESISQQIALLALTCIFMLSSIVMILKLNPYTHSRLWARNFRIAMLSVACIASVLRFCDSGAVRTDASGIALLAGINCRSFLHH